MSKINTSNLVIPDEMTSGWQNIVDLLAEIVSVPAALVMRIYPKHIEVYSSNNNGQHPYRVGDSETLGQGLYCETVVNEQSQLIVPNAEIDPQWQDNQILNLVCWLIVACRSTGRMEIRSAQSVCLITRKTIFPKLINS